MVKPQAIMQTTAPITASLMCPCQSRWKQRPPTNEVRRYTHADVSKAMSVPVALNAKPVAMSRLRMNASALLISPEIVS